MRAVRADGELKLKQQLVGGDALGVLRTAELTAHLAELARSIRQDQGLATVGGRTVLGSLGSVET